MTQVSNLSSSTLVPDLIRDPGVFVGLSLFVIPDIFNRESSVFPFSFLCEEQDAGFLLSQE